MLQGLTRNSRRHVTEVTRRDNEREKRNETGTQMKTESRFKREGKKKEIKCLSHWVPFCRPFWSSLGGPSEGKRSFTTYATRVCVQSSVYVLKILEYVLLVDKRQENCSARVRL